MNELVDYGIESLSLKEFHALMYKALNRVTIKKSVKAVESKSAYYMILTDKFKNYIPDGIISSDVKSYRSGITNEFVYVYGSTDDGVMTYDWYDSYEGSYITFVFVDNIMHIESIKDIVNNFLMRWNSSALVGVILILRSLSDKLYEKLDSELIKSQVGDSDDIKEVYKLLDIQFQGMPISEMMELVQSATYNPKYYHPAIEFAQKAVTKCW